MSFEPGCLDSLHWCGSGNKTAAGFFDSQMENDPERFRILIVSDFQEHLIRSHDVPVRGGHGSLEPC